MDENIEIDIAPNVPALPHVADKTKIDVRYMLIAPYVSAHIYFNKETSELAYEVEEPILQSEEKDILGKIENAMKELINVDTIIEKTQEALINYTDKTARLIISELSLKVSDAAYRKIFYYLFRDFIGLNEIEPLARDYFIEDVECNGINTPVYIVHRIYRNIKTNITFNSIPYLASFVEKLAQRAGRYISYASPILDGSLPDGSRVNATYTTDITSRGPTFTLRKFTKVPWTPTQLIAMNSISPEMLSYLWLVLEHRGSILITGGTGSGKTTMLNAVAFFIPPEARVVSIEDSVTGDAEIITKEKDKIQIMQIKEFVENCKGKGMEVLTLDKEYKLKFVKPSNYIKHNAKKEIYEILTSTGRKVKVTKDHSLFSLGKNGLIEVKPEELKENVSFIAVPRSLPIAGENISKINLLNHLDIFKNDFLCGNPLRKVFENYKRKEFNVSKEKYRWWKGHNIIKIGDFLKIKFKFTSNDLAQLRIKSKNTGSIPVLFEIDREFLEFCGLWLGDGSYDNHNKNVVIVSNTDEECIDIVNKIAAKLNLNMSKMSDGGVSLRIHSTVFYKFMKYVMKLDGYSNSKRIPNIIFNMHNSQLKNLLRGYFSADGTMKKNEISCSSQSYNLLRDIQTILLRFGTISRIHGFERKDKCMEMSISESKNINLFKEIGFLQKRKNEKLCLMHKKSHHAFSDIIPLNVAKLEELNSITGRLSWPYLQGMQNIGREYLQKIAPNGSFFNEISHSDILWDKVRKIRKSGVKEVEVFDLSMPKTEKFICNNILLHNTREINLPRENWLPSVARTGIGAGSVGEIDLFSLLRSSFRQNPDYVIVGEVRGKEAFVLFQGMASGHSSISTMHADSVDTLIKRLETPPIELSPTLLNTLDAVAIMAHAVVNKQETRRLREIVEVVDVNPEGIAITNTPFVWNAADDRFYSKKDSKVFEKISKRYGLSKDYISNEFTRRAKLLYEMFRQKIFEFDEVQKIINEYYKNPEQVLQRFNIK
ncbi:Flp pilus assembly complex ATPase component TadA [Candidatus Pacearchaeota archaeon]|nr:Flp pilus assembly complex ATPase component TadA [Candidatus Pacearchaeota archaeon]